jgi:hypothetical protein
MHFREATETSHRLSAPVSAPASQTGDLSPMVEGPRILLSARSAKVRRSGYSK